MTTCTCYLKTNHPEFYAQRTASPDYEMQIFAEKIIPITNQTTLIDLEIKCKMVEVVGQKSGQIPFMIIPDPSLSLTPITFSTSPIYVNSRDGYYNVILYLKNSGGYKYNFQYGKPIAKIILLTKQFNLITESL